MLPPRHQRGSATALLVIVLALLLGGILFLAGIPLDIRTQVVFSAVIFILCLITGSFRGEFAKSFLIVLTLLISARYMWWRATSTLAFDDPWSAAAGFTLFAAEIYAFFVLCLGYFQTLRPLKRQPVALPDDTADWPTVDIFIPTYNEPIDVVAATVSGALNLEWPRNKLNIYLLDDGNRSEFRQFAAQAGIIYRARTDNKGAKAGNLNEALKHSNGELVAIFDCDQIPVRSFLQMTVGWFLKDDNLAQLQTPQYFYSPDPIEKNLSLENAVPNESSLFYGLIQDGNDLWNAAYFCGSCAILRRTALEDIGGIAEETVTEDAHTSIRLHRKGYGSAYINDIQSAGLATETLGAHINQRIRWARGLAQVFRIDNPLLGRGLSLGQRLCYTNATIHFLYAAPRLIFLLAPLCFLLFDLSIIQSEAVMVAAMALPHIIQNNVTAARLTGRWRHAFWAEIYETVLSFYIFMPTLIALLIPSRGKFNVTQKGHANDADYYAYALARPFIVIGLLNIAAIAVGGRDLLSDDTSIQHTTILNVVWAAYNLIVVGGALAIAREARQTRKTFRHRVSLDAVIMTGNGRRFAATVNDLSLNGARLSIDGDERRVMESLSSESLASVSFDCGNGIVSFPARQVSRESANLRITFQHLGFSHTRELVRVLFSPADRWRTSREDIRHIGVLHSLLRVLTVGIKGWYRVITGFASTRRRAVSDTTDGSPDTTGNVVRTAILAVILALVVATMSLRPEVVRAQDGVAVPGANATVYLMRHLTDKVEKPVQLGTVKYGFSIPFDIRRDTVVNSGTLALRLSWEDAGDTPRSLAITINDRIVWTAQKALGDRETVLVPFSGSQLSDYNTLRFELHYDDTVHCSATSADSFELTIHEGSEIRMDVSSIPIANDLDTLPLPFFDERDPRRSPVAFVMPARASDATLKATGRVAAWFGVLASYRGAEFTVHTDGIPDGHAIVVAPRDDLPPALDWLDAGAPRVLLVDSPVSGSHQLLVVTAPDDESLEDAVSMLLSSTAEHLPARYLSAPVAGTGSESNIANRWIPVDRAITLRDLPGIDDSMLSIQDNNFSPLALPFQVPGDFHPGNGKPHKLSLNYHYAPDFPGFAESLSVSVNGIDLETIDLARERQPSLIDRLAGEAAVSADFAGSLSVDIPHDLIQHNNILEVRFSAPSAISSNCDQSNATQVIAGIDGSSSLDLSNGFRRARYPDLSLFVNTGMPFTQYPDLRETHIQLPATPLASHYALFLSVVSRIATITGNEPAAVSISLGDSPSNRQHRIVISDFDNTPLVNALLSESPLLTSSQGLQARFDRPQDIYHAVSDWGNPTAIARQLELRSHGFDKETGAVMLSARSPSASEGVNIVLLAQSDQAAELLQAAMSDPQTLKSIQGNVLITADNNALSLNTGRNLTVGRVPPLQTIQWWLSDNFITALLLATILAALFATLLPFALNRVAARRLR